MEQMFVDVIREIIYIFNETAVYILFGFLIAGILKVAIPSERVFKHLGEKNLGSVLLASLVGIPLPLCSCAVLPTAISLKRQGASRGATISFLISTPETGVDSISVTYALIDPIMTVFRPVSALITAVTAGLLANLADNKNSINDTEIREADTGCGAGSCSCEEAGAAKKGKMASLFHYAFVELLDDIVFWLIIGIVIAGVISALVPGNFFENYLTGITSMLVMLLVGVPIYMCAASSTPIAAALILKGLNPGAALVFLLAGPATNAGTIAAVGKFLGNKMMIIYLATIAGAGICLGFILNALYAYMGVDPSAAVGRASELIPSYIKTAGSIVLLFLIVRNLWKTGFRNALHAVNDKLYDLTGLRITSSKKDSDCHS